MSVRKMSAKLGLAGLAASAVALTALAPAGAASINTTLNQGAKADYTPASTDIVFAGSDTIQYVVADLADAWNKTTAGAANKIVSYNALADDGGAVAPITGWTGVAGTTDTSITTPNGSGAGLQLLGNTDAHGGSVISFARSSSAPDVSGKLSDKKTSDAVGYPFAIDSVVLAVSAKNTTAPSTLTDAQVLKIYSDSVTNWKDVGGKPGKIDAYIPKSGSGTAKFFAGQVSNISIANQGAKLDDGNGGLPGIPNTYTPAGGGAAVPVPEHSGAPLEADVNGIVPISLGRAIAWNALHKNDIRIIGGFIKQRALWNFARASETTAASNGQNNVPAGVVAGGAITNAILGTSGFFCSTAAQSIIEADGFFPLNSTYCGVQKATSGDIVPSSGSAKGMYVANPLLTVPVASPKLNAAVKAGKLTISLTKTAGVSSAKTTATVKVNGKAKKVSFKYGVASLKLDHAGYKKGAKLTIAVKAHFAGDAVNKAASLTKTVTYKVKKK